MTDDQEILLISEMTEYELLTFIMLDPWYLTDSYYRDWGRAIERRFEQLQKEHCD